MAAYCSLDSVPRFSVNLCTGGSLPSIFIFTLPSSSALSDTKMDLASISPRYFPPFRISTFSVVFIVPSTSPSIITLCASIVPLNAFGYNSGILLLYLIKGSSI